MAQAQGETGFLANLGKVYAIYTGGFLAFVILIAILEQLGVPNQHPRLPVRRSSRSRSTPSSASCRAPRRCPSTTSPAASVPAFYNGMATGADWMSAASFVGMAGTLFLLGYDGLAFVLGWTGGYRAGRRS